MDVSIALSADFNPWGRQHVRGGALYVRTYVVAEFDGAGSVPNVRSTCGTLRYGTYGGVS